MKSTKHTSARVVHYRVNTVLASFKAGHRPYLTKQAQRVRNRFKVSLFGTMYSAGPETMKKALARRSL